MDPTLSSNMILPYEKYHPLILRRTYHGVLSMAVEKINSIKKCEFLPKLLETFYHILTCHKCNEILKENSLAFLCGHKFCKDCSYQATSCLMCQSEGHGSGSKISNLSEISDIINEMKANFNAENIVREMMKLLLMPSQFLTKEKSNSQLPVNDECITPVIQHSDNKTSKKFASTGKRFKKSCSKEDGTKRKLQFVKQDCPDFPLQSSLENDSESLFLESPKDKKVVDNNKYISYLKCSSSVDDSSKFSKLISNSKKSMKRKCQMSENLNLNESTMNKKLRKRSAPKIKKIKTIGDLLFKKPGPNDERTILEDNAKTKTAVKFVDEMKMNNCTSGNSRLKNTLVNEGENAVTVQENSKDDESKRQSSACKMIEVNCNEDHLEHLDLSKKKRKNILKHQTVVKKENENLVLSLPDTETEEVVDINVWEKNEMANKKKKSLFKSVKERNKKSVFNSNSTPVFSSPVIAEESNNSRNDQLCSKEITEDALRNQIVSVDENATKWKKFITNETAIVKHKTIMIDNAVENNIRYKCSENIAVNANIVDINFKNSSKTDSLHSFEVLKSTSEKFDSQLRMVETVPTSVEENTCIEESPTRNGDEENVVLVESSEKIGAAVPSSPPVEIKCNCDIIFEITSQEQSTRNVHAGKDEEPVIGLPQVAREERVSVDYVCADVKNTSSEVIDSVQDSDSIGIVAKLTKKCSELSEGQYVPGSAEREENENVEKFNKEEIRLKCAKLRKVINDQNQKLLVNIKKNFCISSPNSLMVEKNKSPASDAILSITKDSLATPDLCIENVSKRKPELIPDNLNALERIESNENVKPSNENSLSSTHELFDAKSRSAEVLTQLASPFMKSVDCQTTPDLHVALLLQEFPHLFKNTDLPLSVYNTPVDSTGNQNCFSDFKTPHGMLHGASHTKYTVVSSITTSEKKYEKEFAERSVLGDSFYSPLGIDKVVTELEENNSCVPLRPSTEKKCRQSNSDIIEKPKSSVRLNFESNDSANLENCAVSEKSVSILSSTPLLSVRNIKKSLNNHLTYCSGLQTVPRTLSFPDRDEENCSNKKKSNESDEIDFIESVGEQEKCCDNAKKKVDVNDENASDNVLGISSDSDIIPDSCHLGKNSNIHHIVKADREIDAFMNIERAKTPVNECRNANENDDDDVDFVVGTPTSCPKRCVDDSLEKFITQPNCEVTRSELSGLQLSERRNEIKFDNVSFKSQHSQSLLTYFYPLSQSNKNMELERVENVTSSAPNLNKSSIDLFGSVVRQTSSRLYLTTSGLKEVDINVVKSFCQTFSAILLDKITMDTTHVIVKIDQKNRTSRTYKYLQAIVNCISIVSVKWLQDSLQANEILKEESYLPLDSSGECGPLRAYNVKSGLTPSPLSWLQEYCIFISEPIPTACTLPQLHELLTKASAIVISDLKDFKKYPRHHHIVIVSDEEDSTQTSNSEIATWIQMYRAVTVEFNWLIEVIGRSRLLPFAEYELVEIPKDFLLQLNFPAEMLQDDQDNSSHRI